MKVLVFAASLRAGSLNRKLASLAADLARAHGAAVDHADFREFDVPMYDGDLDRDRGMPAGAARLKARVDAADALVIATPEYNYSIAGTLKNVFDWVSRARPMPWRGKSVYLMSASPSPMGGIRGLWQTRIPFEGCGALVFPDMFAVARADEAFAADGTLADPALLARLEKELVGFLLLAEAVCPVCKSDGSRISEKRATEINRALEQESAIQP